MLRIAGPRMTRNMAGKMKRTVGKSILIGAFIARSSAAAWRRRRVSAACTRRIRPSEVPSWSAWMIARVNEETSGVSARSASRFSASPRLSPIRISDERQRELVGQRALHVLGQLRDRAVEARARPRR